MYRCVGTTIVRNVVSTNAIFLSEPISESLLGFLRNCYARAYATHRPEYITVRYGHVDLTSAFPNNVNDLNVFII